jgi:hypothetical protein
MLEMMVLAWERLKKVVGFCNEKTGFIRGVASLQETI